MSDLKAERLQRQYYERTAQEYETAHVSDDEHSIALEYIAQLSQIVHAKSILDVGAGTGRASRYLAKVRPDLRVVGIEPVGALRAEGQGLGTELLVGSGQDIPFDDKSFDLVIATGVMHHIRDPGPVVQEMMRVARLGVLISDSNRFGQGGRLVRAAKIFMCSTYTWAFYNRVRTGGRGYMESEGDGIFYSYSIFDSMPALSNWADRTFVVPTSGKNRGRLGSLLDAPSGLLVAFRDQTPGPGHSSN